MKLTRSEMEARAELFDKFALKDQKIYYDEAIKRHRTALRQVNRIRATLSLFTGIAAAFAALLVQSNSDMGSYSDIMRFIVGFAAFLAVILPAFGSAFSTLADLYQWDKLISIYDAAVLNLEEADALSPNPKLRDNVEYRASMRAFAEGTLQVMSDETAQWGQSVRTPRQIDSFIKAEQRRAHKTVAGIQGGAFKDRLDDDHETP
jgi:hypothetical protein